MNKRKRKLEPVARAAGGGGHAGPNRRGENADLQPRGGVTARRLFTSVVPLDAIKCTRFGGSPGTAGASPSPACRRRVPRSASILEIAALLQRNIMNTNLRTTCTKTVLCKNNSNNKRVRFSLNVSVIPFLALICYLKLLETRNDKVKE